MMCAQQVPKLPDLDCRVDGWEIQKCLLGTYCVWIIDLGIGG